MLADPMPLRYTQKDSSLYAVLYEHLDVVLDTILANAIKMLDNKDFAPKTPVSYKRSPVLKVTSGVQVFYPVATLIYEHILSPGPLAD